MDSLSSFSVLILTLGILLGFWPSSSRLPPSLPWAGLRREVFSKTRARFREMTAGMRTLSDGYSTYNKKGQSFVILDAKGRPQVIVPKELVNWCMGQPHDVLSVRHVQHQKFGLKYLQPPIQPSEATAFIQLVRPMLARRIGKMQAGIFSTMRETIDARMGLDDASWREVNLFETLHPIVFKSICRAMYGLPLCENDDFLDAFESFNTGIGAGAVLLGQYLPSFITPVIGLLFSMVVGVYRTRVLKFILPVAEERSKNIKLENTDPSSDDDCSEDIMTWAITNSSDTAPSTIANNFLSLMLGAIHTTSTAALNLFVDLLSSPPELRYFESLREEVVEAIRADEDWLHPELTMKLSRTDSAIRESLRHNPILGRPSTREVVPKDGITIPGVSHLPQGTWVATAALSLHMDERYYPEPKKYDPFRFSRGREEDASISKGGSTGTSGDAKSKNYLSTTSDTFLTFGHGRHACPGRWLAAYTLKLMLAYITLNYDIQPLTERRADIIFGDFIIPSRETTVMIRRRKALL